ncbi:MULTISPECIES: hypothetical protein [Protofrankia]|uniref:hypothetical protein n=1 Tax=Protofrankia TaxID=2994361 RepID=UPI000B138C8A|nr:MULTISPECIES: hypothetical protein [Protofrankia]
MIALPVGTGIEAFACRGRGRAERREAFTRPRRGLSNLTNVSDVTNGMRGVPATWAVK